MSTDRIPLFPLNVVLFPGQAMPLHIFERRYRIMTRHCMDTKSLFGIIFFQEGNLAEIGCSARIVKVLKEYEDGRCDILTSGQRAFRLIRTQEEQAYAEGDVVYLEEEFSGVDAAVSIQLEALFQQCHRILFEAEALPLQAEGNPSLAYYVASELPMDSAFRQTLLELRSEVERQERLVERLTIWLPQLQNRQRARGKAAGNGHSNL